MVSAILTVGHIHRARVLSIQHVKVITPAVLLQAAIQEIRRRLQNGVVPLTLFYFRLIEEGPLGEPRVTLLPRHPAHRTAHRGQSYH